MKTPFALDLSRDAVRLLRECGPDAALVGEVRLDDPEFDARVEALRRDGEALARGPVEATVLVPHSEVLFTSVAAEGPEASAEARVREALDGLTPYPLDELAYDWTAGDGTTLAVAAVARKTLAEAEAFAAGHGFRPVRLATPPAPEAFGAAPDFGPASRAAAAPASRDAPEADTREPTAAATRHPAVRPERAAPPARTDPETGAGPGAAGERSGLDALTARLALRPDAGDRSAAAEQSAPTAGPPRATGGPRPPRPPGPPAPIAPIARRAERTGPVAAATAQARDARSGRQARPVRRAPSLSALVGGTLGLLLAVGFWAGRTPMDPRSEDGVAARTGNAESAATAPAAANGARAEPDDAEPAGAASVRDPAPRRDGPPRQSAQIPAAEDRPAADPAPFEAAPGKARADTPPPTLRSAPPDDTAATGGVRVRSGRPPAVPPARPTRLEGGAAPAPETAAAEPANAPRPRPAGLSPGATGDGQALGADTARALAASRVGAAGSVDAADLGIARAVLEDVDAASARPGPAGGTGIAPRARPAVETSSAAFASRSTDPDTARPDTTPSDAAASDAPRSGEMRQAAEAIAAIVPDIAAPDPAAVSRSLRPDSRPRTATADSRGGTESVRVAAAGTTFTPRSATSGPVASRATEPRTLRLNRVSLIGVYGSQANRRALLRLPSGRFVKVQVGDRVDGGRVSAIGQSELQYVKGGRRIDLALPQG